MKQLSDIDVSGKRVFLRSDLDVLENVGAATNGEREANYEADLEKSVRLQNIKPTVDRLLERGAKQIIIAGHLDDPGGKPNPALSSEQLIRPLEKILKRSVVFKGDLEIPEPGSLQSLSQLVLLENLRFWPEEEANDPGFSQRLSSLADIYVNNAFASWRPHSSVVGVPAHFPDKRALGLHFMEEVEFLSGFLKNPKKPFLVIIGGAKSDTKIKVIDNLASISDSTVFVGGLLPVEIKRQGRQFPSNVVIATLAPDGLDIDDDSIDKANKLVKGANSIMINGPMGHFESGHIKGTRAVWGGAVQRGVDILVGGGDSEKVLREEGWLEEIEKHGHYCDGGGAMLVFATGEELPAIKALS